MIPRKPPMTAASASPAPPGWRARHRPNGYMTASSASPAIYQFDLAGFSEHFQYTVYHASEGGHFGWHIDQIPNGAHRKLSFSLQLSDPGDYDGCDLELQCGPAIRAAPRTRGTLVAFPAYAIHRVTPIVSGTRRALVIWTAGPPFR